MSRRKAEIAGAGLAGLAIAVRLAQLGWQVRLHERGDDLRVFGAGIWLWENGLKSLEIMGAFEAATARARRISEWRIADGRGHVLMTRPMTDTDRLLLPPRADLYAALIDRAETLGVEIRTASLAVDMRPEGVLVLSDGTECAADLVIAADGAYSRLREGILGTRWMDFGIEAGIRMLIDQRDGDPTEIITEYWQGSWRLLFNPCTDDQNYIFLSAPIDDERGRRVPVDREAWIEKFPFVANLIERFEEAGRWDRIVNVRCRTWSEGRAALLGDAAHAMPPNLGQAANTAFMNAMALAAMVDRSTDIPQALRSWEAQVRPLTEHIQWWSYLYGFVLGKWPSSLVPLRSDLLRFIARTEWFEESLNRGARHVPAGYRAAGASGALRAARRIAEIPSGQSGA